MKRWLMFRVWAVVFAVTSAHAQVQVQKLHGSDTHQGDFFGRSVGLSGDWALVGMPDDDDVQSQSGAVYAFQRQGTGWVEVQKIKAGDASFGAYFGADVQIDGDRAAVSAHNAAAGTIASVGRVYVFGRTSSSWVQQAMMVPSDPTQGKIMGYSVALSGDRILAGAVGDATFGFQSGAVYVFEKIGSSWVQTAKLTASDAAWGDQFGWNVALDGDTAVVGAPSVDGPAATDQGALYVFEKQGAVWVQVQKIFASDAAPNDILGSGDVKLVGDTIAARMRAHPPLPTDHGAVYVFERRRTGWVETQRLSASDVGWETNFGERIALEPERMLVSGVADSDLAGTGTGSGAAFFFRKVGATWIQYGKLLAQDGAAGDLFGVVAMHGDLALVGAHSDDDACPTNPNCNSGSAYVFDLSSVSRQYGSCPTAAPCNNADTHGGCRNSTGQGGILAAAGSGSVVTDDLRLEAAWLPPNVNGILFMGAAQTSVALGDGLRVAAPGAMGLFRYGVSSSGTNGRVILGPGLVQTSQGFLAPGQIQAGQTWNFQYWYRNVQGPCGTFTNLTNGVEVAFGP